MNSRPFHIRRATVEDTPTLLSFIQKLADFEKEPHEVTVTEKQLQNDGFGKSPLFIAFLIELQGHPCGFCLCYFRYSTWKGKTLYLEDLFIDPEYRGQGLGKEMMMFLNTFARDQNCQRFDWQVLDWNTSAIDFYKSLGAEILPQWQNCRLGKKAMENLAEEDKILSKQSKDC